MFLSTTLEVKKTSLLFFLFVSAALLSCAKKEERPYVNVSGPAQGTSFSITYQPVDEVDYTPSIDSLFELIDQSMSLWRDSSLINKVNRSSGTVLVDEHFANVFRGSEYFHSLSAGAFDPTVGPLLKFWKFARKSQESLPDTSQIRSIKEKIGLSHFKLSEDRQLTKDIPEATLDFNAIAQGYTVDVLADFLKARGVKQYLIEVGGEIRAQGINQSGAPWKVGIERPDFNQNEDRNEIETILALDRGALATSGSYRKYVEVDGKKYSHTIDPKTGFPVDHHMLSVSVIAPSAMDADAYATMFMVLGKEAALAFANEHDLQIQCTSEEGGVLEITRSKDFDELLLKE
ncbi:FAD:protein FMN transferase [Marinilongibacter aquaticus]|uniref:FAD:protein FMN transferase n=1 Tax=Marinilongibacter aquaticus TaxID=2975157 RepID=UPI0021BD84A7|nr:FAD:protein FMN transferase [Marinilongibacter aquaticus]UBM57961.1 FAD:protein FMN transferase [Marinilongibacter aquaticus]